MAKKKRKSTEAHTPARGAHPLQFGTPATGGRGPAKSGNAGRVSATVQPRVPGCTTGEPGNNALPMVKAATRASKGTTINLQAITRGARLITASAVGKPRFDAQERLLHRFYEPLVLLHTLDPIRGAHLQRPTLDRSRSSGYETGELRRTFVDKLAYICDYDKGGDSVTAIALQRLPDKVVFVVAANNNVRPKVTSLLQSILLQLRDCAALTEEKSVRLRDKIGAQCIELSRARVEAYRRFLREPLRMCIASLQQSMEGYKVEIANELSKFDGFEGDIREFCRLGYAFRKSKSFIFLDQKVAAISGSSEGINLDKNVFAQTRHYIGRLGSHLTAAKTLVDAAKHLPFLFDDFEIQTVPRQASSLPPACVDDKVTLDGILRRMMPQDVNDEEFQDLKSALQDMNEKHNLETGVRDAYENKNFQPQVHAELTILEHFHNNKLDFVDDDPYIGCSKPACYCCWLYIRAHPGRFAEPACHSKIYLNWKPPSYSGHGHGSEETQRIHTRNILNEMAKTVRADVKKQIMARSGRGRWHPDSTTGITASINKVNIEDPPSHHDEGSQASYSPSIEAPALEQADEKLENDAGQPIEGSKEYSDDESRSEDSDDAGGVLL